MQELEARPANPELKELVVEASRALARLDTARLEELALSCQALTRDTEARKTQENGSSWRGRRGKPRQTWRSSRGFWRRRAPI